MGVAESWVSLFAIVFLIAVLIAASALRRIAVASERSAAAAERTADAAEGLEDASPLPHA